MPQMAPIWWSTLFCMFILSYLMVMVSMYFFNIYVKKQMNIEKVNNKSKINWKW